jgi:epsilon-lactone hydrolase
MPATCSTSSKDDEPMSLRARLATVYLRATRRRVNASDAATARSIAAPKTTNVPPAKLRRTLAIDRQTMEGRPCWILRPKSGATRGAVIYLHGGSYVHEIVKEHWALVARLVTEAKCTAYVPIYGLAPESDFREGYAFAKAVYRHATSAHDPAHVVLAGDSAGGGFALGLALVAKREGLPRVARIVLLAPWLDIALENPAIADVERNDPWLTRRGLLTAGRAWANGADPRLPELSPIHGDLAGLPQMTIYVGTRDILWPDAVVLARHAKAAGVEVELVEAKGMMHVYPLVPIPEGRAAADRIVRDLTGLLS